MNREEIKDFTMRACNYNHPLTWWELDQSQKQMFDKLIKHKDKNVLYKFLEGYEDDSHFIWTIQINTFNKKICLIEEFPGQEDDIGDEYEVIAYTEWTLFLLPMHYNLLFVNNYKKSLEQYDWVTIL